MMKQIIYLSLVGLISILLAACGTEKDLLSPKEVINTMLQESDEPLSYYGEYTMIVNDDSGDYEVKEWISKEQKRRIEMTSTDGKEQVIAVNDKKTITMYDKTENMAMEMPIGEEDIAVLSSQTPRQQAENMLEMVKDSHELSAGEETEIAGRSTYHIIATAKDDYTLLGDMEIWVDKETWLPLKTMTNNAGNRLTIEYEKVDFKADMAEDLFVLEIPEDVVIEKIDEEAYESIVVTVEEVSDELGSFYQLREEDGLELSKITVLSGMEERPEFTFDYTKDDMLALSVRVFKDFPDTVDFGGVEEETVIRGKKATKMEMGDFRSLDWVEDGLTYVVLIDNPEIGFEDVEQYLEEMVLTE